MKLRRWNLILLACLLLATGCFAGQTDDPGIADAGGDSSAPDLAVMEQGQPARYGEGTVTVLDLKKKYGSDDAPSLMPLYNVARDEVFTFRFAAAFEDVQAREVVSVHTDIKALPQSEIHAFISFTDFLVQDTVEIKPSTGVLASSDAPGGFSGWGNAPVYYIRINYDLDAPVPTKLDEPVIVPFTLQSELPVPTLRHEIDARGQFKLTWSAVEGATSYRVYNRAKHVLLDTVNLPVSGPEEGYVGGYPLLQAEVEGTELDWFLSSFAPDDPEDESYVIGQNQGLNGEYYVTAVNGERESNFSNAVNTIALSSQIPRSLQTNIGYQRYESLSLLPQSADISMIDGSVKTRDFVFDYAGATLNEIGEAKIAWSVKGTAFKGEVTVANVTQAALDAMAGDERGGTVPGFVEPENKTEYVPSPDVPTIIEAAPGPEPSGEPSATRLTEQQKANTEQQVEEGNQAPVPTPEPAREIEINADSALEEYLALYMIDGAEQVSLQAFPEAQNFETLSDIMLKTIYQNPLIMGVRGWQYDYGTLTLEIAYDYTSGEIKQKQEEVIAEARRLAAELIVPGMSNDEKHKAIYDYFNDHTRYDTEALESAEANGFLYVDPAYNDSFTTYGIMVKKVGVCASYASAYKMLSDLIGLESIVVTGDMDGIPHAWNKVKLENGWVHVDPTNNETNSGIPYLLFNTSDETAEALNFALSDEFWVDRELGRFASTDNSRDYYIVNGLEVGSPEEFGVKLSEKVKAGETYIVLRYTGIWQESMVDEALDALSQLPEQQLANAGMGALGPYVVVYY